ncbi:type II secretion system protein F (GspF) [Seinonella peptonophila]|uniref:Type II secretion system protein F (GspF) n=1 Tax=Seinonella peptonophila TaxID=112248 RepID=A0A1M4V4L2_9BACL|nr:type II secretion system F family protein [Seinonella peptonophila]SHE63832.1 type II secretion system protein F (GspF) [Seinonella peptonophila]
MWRVKKQLSAELLARLSEQMMHLLQNDIPLLESIELLVEQKFIPEKIGRGLIEQIEAGNTLSAALEQLDFPALYLSLIRIAEESGGLAAGFSRCYQFYHQKDQFRQEVIQASIYPLIVLGCICLALLFMVTVILPRFTELYQSLGISLPPLTRWIVSMSSAVDQMIYLFILIFLIIILVFSKQTVKLERFFLHIPGIRSLYRYRFTHYFALQLGSLLQSGVPLLQSLELIAKLSPWIEVTRAVQKVKECLVKGDSLQLALENCKQGIFETFLPRLTAIGERTGRLEEILLHVANTMERLIRLRLQKYVKGMEPLFILLLGVVILVVVVSLFLPMLQLVQAI